MFLYMASPIILVLVFIVASVVGYFVIKKIPSLLHTPLMSGMNALSGITIVGAIAVLIDALVLNRNGVFLGGSSSNTDVAIILSGIAIVLAVVNVVGGFGVTERMLRMFKTKKDGVKKGGEIK